MGHANAFPTVPLTLVDQTVVEGNVRAPQDKPATLVNNVLLVCPTVQVTAAVVPPTVAAAHVAARQVKCAKAASV